MGSPANPLAPNGPDWTPPATTPTPLDAGPPSQPTPPVTVTTPDNSQVSPVEQPQPMLQPDAAPDYTQPTVTPDRESWWRRALDTVGSIMGGDQTIHITKTPDGTMTVSHDPSTAGEKWGRVAAAMLGGAAKGLAAGQGPGGAAKAAAAGAEFGQQLPQQALKQANEQAASMNAQQLAAANIALLHQKMVTQGLLSQQAGLTLAGQQADLFNKIADAGKGSPNATVLPTVDNMPDMAKLPLSYANALQAHTNGQLVMYVTPGANGKVAFTPVITDRAYSTRLNDKPRDVLSLGVDPTTKEPIIQHTTVDPLTHTNGDLDKGNQGVTVQYLTQHNAWMKANAEANKPAPGPKTIPAIELAAQQETDPVKRQQFLSTLSADQRRELAQRAASRAPVLPGVAPAPAGTTGDAYLQAAVDPSMWNQVRLIANGDVKMPTAGMRGANQALRSAVMNYDPTYTDARYDTKQNFKTKGDATSVMQLSTAMAHADRALRNSAQLGDSLSLLTGRNLSGTAAAYNTDANFFTGEAGKLAMGGIVGEHEAERIRNQISSPVQSIRDDALHEVLRLTSGKVGALVHKYRVGAGQDLPVHEFFDQPTQDLLTRYKIIGQPAPTGGGTPPPTGNTRQIPQGAVAGRDPQTGQIIGYKLNGQVVRF